MIREPDFSSLPRFVKIKGLNKSDKEDYFLSLIALIQFPLLFVQLLLISFGWESESTTIYRVVFSAGSILFALPIIIKRKGGKFVVFYLLIIILYFIHYFLFPETIEYWHENAFRFLIPICIPTLFCMLSIKNIELFYIAIKQICYITAMCGLVYGVRLITGAYNTEEIYFMNFGFLLLLPVIIFFLENTWYSISLSLLFFILIIVFCSRGPLIAVAIFAAYYIIRKKKYFLLLSIVVLVMFGFTAFSSYLDSLGLFSRTIQMYMDGEMTAVSGRDEIQESIYRGIRDNPIIGNGLFGDRVLSMGYAHNFFIEIICQWGIFLGGVFLISLLYEIIYVVIKLRDSQKDIFVAMMCVLFIPLMTSESYLQSPNFFTFIGLLVILRKRIQVGRNCVPSSSEIVKSEL